jgi:hypothetical protein
MLTWLLLRPRRRKTDADDDQHAVARGHPLAVERYRDLISEVRGKTIHHSSELGRWEMVLGDPAPGLCLHVRGYRGYAEETVAFSRRRELATAQAVLIVGFGPPIEVSFPRLGTACAQPRSSRGSPIATRWSTPSAASAASRST